MQDEAIVYLMAPFLFPAWVVGLGKVTSRDLFQLHSIVLILMDKYLWFGFPGFFFCSCLGIVSFPKQFVTLQHRYDLVFIQWYYIFPWRNDWDGGTGVLFFPSSFELPKKESSFQNQRVMQSASVFQASVVHLSWEKSVFMITVRNFMSEEKRGGKVLGLLFLERRHEHCSKAVL